MGLYWAWRGAGKPTCEPPTVKVIDYEDFGYMRIACAVTEGDKVRTINRGERKWHRNLGKPKQGGWVKI